MAKSFIMAGCVTGKKMYARQELAEDALLEAWTRFDYTAGNGPVSVYRCEDCGEFHLTSTGSTNPRLAEYLKSDKLKLLKEANRWESKFKKR